LKLFSSSCPSGFCFVSSSVSFVFHHSSLRLPAAGGASFRLRRTLSYHKEIITTVVLFVIFFCFRMNVCLCWCPEKKAELNIFILSIAV